ncbi:MAG TPA: tRNA pseudouridine(55) synthase TruB [Rubrobacteraceae bacterium]|nr:tRNA pseudouridine(55) synthase TruB [Rubrobacteraceae bacterium]
MQAFSGALLLDKPSGLTSARAVARVKRLLPKGTRIGHTGTLDPLASGLLVLLIGRATRLSRYVTGFAKEYTATAHFGAVSDTLDADGEITALEHAPMPDVNALHTATKRFTGEIRQIPPMASAVKVGGERLYKALRRGESVERESRPATVHAFELLSLDGEKATFYVSCGSGTYVRTLVAALADSLGTGAYLTTLRRTRVGHMNIQDAVPLEDLGPDRFINRIIQARVAVAHLPGVEVSEGERYLVCNGGRLGTFGVGGSFRVEAGGELLAIYRDEGEVCRAEVVLCGP